MRRPNSAAAEKPERHYDRWKIFGAHMVVRDRISVSFEGGSKPKRKTVGRRGKEELCEL